jgi:hypothetical protein
VDIDVPQKSKLYCALFLAEDDTDLVAYVSRSQAVLGSASSEFTNEIKLPDAIVTLLSDAGEEQFNYDSDNGYFTLSRSSGIKQNVNYTVVVKQGGEVTEGTCLLPVPANFDIFYKIDSIYDANNNFYVIRLNGNVKLLTALKTGVTLMATIILEDSSRYLMYNSARDRVAMLSLGETMSYNFTQNTQLFGIRPVAIEIQAYTITEDVYKYQKYASSIDLSTFFPFAEPVFIHSNMTSGIGIIGAYTKSGNLRIPIP